MPTLNRALAVSDRLLEVALPHGGYAVMLAEVYIDESGSHAGSPVLCLAGYIFASGRANEFSQRWAKALDSYRLPFFHMVDCAHGAAPFDGLSPEQRIAVEKEMIALIREYSEYGFAVSVYERDYDSVIPPGLKAHTGSAYSFCVRQCLTLVKDWLNSSDFKGDVAYYFEAGHARQCEALSILNDIFNERILVNHYQHAAHVFADKRKFLPLQAADLLAWQWHTDKKHKMLRQPPRKDFAALLRPQDKAIDFNRERLEALVSHLAAGASASQR